MEIVMDNKKIMAMLIVFILMAAGIVYLVIPNDPGRNYTGMSVDDKLDEMDWGEIMEEAQGQTVTLSFYRDTYNDRFFDEVLIPAAARYGVNVKYGDDLGYIGALKDSQSGGTPRYDMYWMGVGGYGAFAGEDGLWWNENWKGSLPNAIYLGDNTDNQVSYLLGNSSKYVGNELEFSGGQLVMMYNEACEDPTLAYDRVKLTNSSNETVTVTMVEGTGGVYAWGATNANMTSLTNYLKANASVKVTYGLPNDYTELMSWVKIYPGQFTHPSPLYGTNSYFVGDSFLYGIAYELQPDNVLGWKEADNIETNVEKVNTDIAKLRTDYPDDSDFKTEFEGYFEYVFEYLEELDDYVHKVDGKNYYPDSTADIHGKMVGINGTTNIVNDQTVMLSFTVNTSQYNRLATADFNTGVYSMKTSVMEQYCWTINKDSKSKAGSLVVADLFLNPEIQAKWFEMTGEIVNSDYLERYTDLLGGAVSEYYKAQYDKNFGFLTDWDDKKWAYLSPSVTAVSAVDCNLSKYSATWDEIWKASFANSA